LGILEKDENITEQMVEIVEHLQQYAYTGTYVWLTENMHICKNITIFT
jgi:hypothetical protein